MNKKLEEYSREELIEEIKSLKRRKKFGLVWEDKKEDIVEKCKNEIPVLKEVPELAINEKPGEPTNLIIEGDNFASLQVLNYTHHGKIDVIYIDPPYNTGNKDFIYNDSYVDSEDSFRHSKWLSFMDRRLRLAKELLSDDGVIFISIDDNEQAELKLLCDSIFGQDNFLVNMVVVAAPAGTQSSVDFAQQHAYCLAYRRSDKYKSNYIKLKPDEIANKYNYGEDKRGRYYIERIWKRGIGGRMEDVPSLHFPVYYNPKTKEIVIDNDIEKVTDKEAFEKIIPYQTQGVLGRWTWSREKMRAEKDSLIVVRVAGEWKLHKKVYSEQDSGRKPYSIIDSKIGRTELGSIELKNVMNEKIFDYPKYSVFMGYLFGLHRKNDAIILDFFAGSGTTGQAVLELNKEDGGNRKFILCTNNESNIARDVTYPRIKTVVTGIRPDGSKYSDGIPANVRYFTTDFIEKGITGDATRAKLLEKTDEMIQVRENAFEFVDKNDNYTFYKNSEKFVAIIKDPFNFGPIWYELEEKNTEKLPVKLYVFSYSNYTFEDEIPDTDLKYEICAIPNSIMEVYRKISDKKEEK